MSERDLLADSGTFQRYLMLEVRVGSALSEALKRSQKRPPGLVICFLGGDSERLRGKKWKGTRRWVRWGRGFKRRDRRLVPAAAPRWEKTGGSLALRIHPKGA